MENENIIRNTLNNDFNPYVIERAIEETKYEKVLKVYITSYNNNSIYLLTDKKIYIIEGNKDSKAVSCRRSKFVDLSSFNLYRHDSYDSIAIITDRGHVVFVLKFMNLTTAMECLRTLYEQQVLNDPFLEDKDKVKFDFDNYRTYPA